MKSLAVKISAILLASLAMAAGGPPADAQMTGNDLTILASPENPGEFKEVRLDLTSYLINLDKAGISWYRNGKKELAGPGEKKFSFQTREIGSKETIKAAVAAAGGPIEAQITIVPAEVDLLWQAVDSYTPPFYKGKALPARGAQLKAVAIPNAKEAGKKLTESNFVFNWRRDFEAAPDSSGYGKNYFKFKSNYLKENETIEAALSAVRGNLGTSEIISIQTSSPQIIFYQSHPLRGIEYNQALNRGFQMELEETTLVAEPYFFSPKEIQSPELRYQWSVNGEEVDTPAKKNTLIIRSSGQSGSARVNLSLENFRELFQSAQESISINL